SAVGNTTYRPRNPSRSTSASARVKETATDSSATAKSFLMVSFLSAGTVTASSSTGSSFPVPGSALGPVARPLSPSETTATESHRREVGAEQSPPTEPKEGEVAGGAGPWERRLPAGSSECAGRDSNLKRPRLAMPTGSARGVQPPSYRSTSDVTFGGEIRAV